MTTTRGRPWSPGGGGAKKLRADKLRADSLKTVTSLKLRSLDSSSPFFLSDNSIWGQ